jgi:hypothetical protein
MPSVAAPFCDRGSFVFLIVYANRLAPGVPADLVSGPFVAGADLTVQTADGTQHGAAVEEADGQERVVIEMAGERWRLKRRPAPGSVRQDERQVPTEYWTIASRA